MTSDESVGVAGLGGHASHRFLLVSVIQQIIGKVARDEDFTDLLTLLGALVHPLVKEDQGFSDTMKALHDDVDGNTDVERDALLAGRERSYAQFAVIVDMLWHRGYLSDQAKIIDPTSERYLEEVLDGVSQ